MKSMRLKAIGGLTVLALAGAIFGLAILVGHATPFAANAANVTLGVDVTTAGNSESQLGTIDTCKRVEVGDDFDVDLYITNVTDLQHWEFYLDFDSSRISLTDQTFMMLTGYGPPPVLVSAGKEFLGVGSTTPVSGSGVLARVTFHAYAPGVSNIAISHNPLWPIVEDADPDPSGYHYFDGPLTAARIAIGQSCPNGAVITDTPGPTVAPPTPTPSPTPSPTPTPTPTLVPTQTPVATGTLPTFVISPTATPAPTSSAHIQGDADCNGTIGVPDVLAALTDAAIGTANSCQGRTDTDCDGFVTANDVLRLLRYLSGDLMPQPDGCMSIGSPLG